MRDDWTFEDRERLLAEAFAAQDEELLARIWWGDNFEPSLGFEGGLMALICTTRQEKAAERKRVKALYAERAAIKAKWA